MIRIYYMKIEDCSEMQRQALYEMLPPERKESVARAKKEEIAKKRLYTGAFLQRVLSKETGIPINELQYEYNEWGKPNLKRPEMITTNGEEHTDSYIHFNLSHSGNYVVLAVSNQPIGIDVEYKTTNYATLAKRCFCEGEYNDIMSQDTDTLQERRFLEYWTMKEAYIKCLGEGLRVPLNSFMIKPGNNGISYVEEKDMWFGTFYLDERYCVSICSSCLYDVEESVKQKEQGIQKLLFLTR